MKRWITWLPILLVLLGTLGAAVLTLWLGGNLLSRELRQSAARTEQAEAARFGWLLQAQLAAFADAAAVRKPRADNGSDPAGAVKLPTELAGTIGAALPAGAVAPNPAAVAASPVTGLLLVDPLSRRVVDSTVAGIEPGQQLRESGADKALTQAAQRRAGSNRAAWYIDPNTRPLTAWHAAAWSANHGLVGQPDEQLGSSVEHLLLIQVPVDALIRRVVAASGWVGQAEQAGQAMRTPVVRTASASGGQPGFLLPAVEPDMTLTLAAQPVQQLPTVAPLFGRGLLGASLVALLLSAVWWRAVNSTNGKGIDTERQPVSKLMPRKVRATIQAVRNNDFDARCALTADEDPDGVGAIIDQLLDQRARLMVVASKDREALAQSLSGLQQAVEAMTSDFDFATPVPAQDDATGAVADAVRNLTDRISQQSSSLQTAAGALLAKTERVHESTDELEPLVARFEQQLEEQLTGIRSLESDLDQVIDAGDNATDVVGQARAAVSSALAQAQSVDQALHTARHELRVTEKRVKTVAERSQEIGTLVGTIADLAERTGILALNASLQAAANDGTGRQFAPIAQEVKRLADSAGGAADQASRLVNAIRDETRFTAQATATATTSIVALSSRVAENSRFVHELSDGMDSLAEQLSGVTALAQRYRDEAPRVSGGVAELTGLKVALSSLLRGQVGAARELRADAQQLVQLASRMPRRSATGQPGSEGEQKA